MTRKRRIQISALALVGVILLSASLLRTDNSHLAGEWNLADGTGRLHLNSDGSGEFGMYFHSQMGTEEVVRTVRWTVIEDQLYAWPAGFRGMNLVRDLLNRVSGTVRPLVVVRINPVAGNKRGEMVRASR
jgi:hypothetical protein